MWMHIHTTWSSSPKLKMGASLQFHTNKWRFLIFCHQHSDGGWNDNKWGPLEELLAIKGNRESQYTTPVSLTKLKQITPTFIAYYPANEDDLFIIIIVIHLFDHHWPQIPMTSITSFPVCKHSRRGVSVAEVNWRLLWLFLLVWLYVCVLLLFTLISLAKLCWQLIFQTCYFHS